MVNKEMKRGKEQILMTGGAGYIGSVLVGYLLEAGHSVTVVDNLIYRQQSLLEYCSHEGFEFVYGDCRNEETMAEVMKGKTMILPLAALVGAPLCSMKPMDAVSVNLDAIKLILKLRSKDQKVIYPTTNSGYGITSGDLHCTEETPLEPISLYGRTKVDAEKALLAEENVITLRLATVFGMSPRMRTDLLVNDFVQKAVMDGTLVIFEKHFKRNYIHVRDVSRCFVHCIENFEKMKNTAYNVGLDDANLSKEELANAIKKQVPKLVIVFEEIAQDPDKRNYIVSNKKLYSTGFTPEHGLDVGIAELIKGYGIVRNNQTTNK